MEKLTAKVAKLESACAKDIKKYCKTVTPGEGRMRGRPQRGQPVLPLLRQRPVPRQLRLLRPPAGHHAAQPSTPPRAAASPNHDDVTP